MTLDKWLKKQKMSNYRLAKIVGMDISYLGRIVRGCRRSGAVCSPQMAERISAATNGAVKVMEILYPEGKR